ncbi:hypothetical protein BGAL_0020g00300 [Botrytis galanthina]|uniref:Uncharacterized protein n=1 Tax=Botrytis galanthina TaxID=278940 RepID=A0A4V4HVW9_9HELO|nr:hypothetical protein BGAL_0020g00300 [Botrytis galanthina]
MSADLSPKENSVKVSAKSKPAKTRAPNSNVIARASDKIVEDFEGAQECIKLLHTVHSDVIEAIITNTIAYRWATDPEFRKLTYPRDNLSGIYLVCFSTEGREGEYLTSLENERLEDNMESYLRSEKTVVPDDAPDNSEDVKIAEKAAKIERYSIGRETHQNKLRRDTRAGIRQLTFFRQELSVRKLKEYRICPTLDPTGNIRQIQTPCQVGCATNLLTRSSAHDPQTKMKTSSTYLTLTVSTLEAMGLKQNVFQIPILKVWRPNQLGLAEIFITMLAGSLVWDGGLNRIKAGAKDLDQSTNPDVVPDKRNLLEAKRQIFLDHKWAMENFRASNEALLRQANVLKAIQEKTETEEDIKTDANELLKEIKEVSERETIIRRKVEERTEEIQEKDAKLTACQTEIDDSRAKFEILSSNYEQLKGLLDEENKKNQNVGTLEKSN